MNSVGYAVKYPVRHGIVEDWDLMEHYWEHCIFKYLRVEACHRPCVSWACAECACIDILVLMGDRVTCMVEFTMPTPHLFGRVPIDYWRAFDSFACVDMSRSHPNITSC